MPAVSNPAAHQGTLSSLPFLRACRRQPVTHTPVWLMRQAGRYMAEYRAVRKQHSLLEICHDPKLAAEVTITAAERLGVDAAIIFADLLLPLEAMGVPFHFAPGEGPVIAQPIRTTAQIEALHTDRAAELDYVSQAVALTNKHFGGKLPVIGFCGAPFTVASYMVEGGSSRHYIATKKMMYGDAGLWDALLTRLVDVLLVYSRKQIASGAVAFQVFDSWVGVLSPEDFRRFVLPHSKRLIAGLRETGVPVIYFGTDTATLLPDMASTGADVMGVDWRYPLAEAWQALDAAGYEVAVQGNLDPILLLGPQKELLAQARRVLDSVAGRAGHIFNLGHGIVPETPVENVLALVKFVQEYSAELHARGEVQGEGNPQTTVRAR